ncbi:hypothetical protein HaLaN_08688, partial [Haematococcus lacustris]
MVILRSDSYGSGFFGEYFGGIPPASRFEAKHHTPHQDFNPDETKTKQSRFAVVARRKATMRSRHNTVAALLLVCALASVAFASKVTEP